MKIEKSDIQTIKTTSGKEFKISTYTIYASDYRSADDTGKQKMIEDMKNFIREMVEKSEKDFANGDSIRTTINYEFYDENDDWHENQKEFAKILGFNLNALTYNTVHNLEEIEQLVSFKGSGGKEHLDKILSNRTVENGKGKYEYLDSYAYYEPRESYYIVYIQYKIKKLQH